MNHVNSGDKENSCTDDVEIPQEAKKAYKKRNSEYAEGEHSRFIFIITLRDHNPSISILSDPFERDLLARSSRMETMFSELMGRMGPSSTSTNNPFLQSLHSSLDSLFHDSHPSTHSDISYDLTTSIRQIRSNYIRTSTDIQSGNMSISSSFYPNY